MEVPYSAVQKGQPDKPINIRLEFARGSLRSQLLAQQTLRVANMRESDENRPNYELECADARIEDLEAKLLLPDEDVLLTSLRPGETTEIEKEIELSTLRIRQGEMTLSEIDELWRRIELLRKTTENSLDAQLTELAIETNRFHEQAELTERGHKTSVAELSDELVSASGGVVFKPSAFAKGVKPKNEQALANLKDVQKCADEAEVARQRSQAVIDKFFGKRNGSGKEQTSRQLPGHTVNIHEKKNLNKGSRKKSKKSA